MFYLAEKFGVDIVVNPDYYRYNNTSTLMLVADRLENTYICSSDDYFAENPFEPFVYRRLLRRGLRRGRNGGVLP